MESDKRKQHYIPKFYLRNFSFQKNGKQIGVFNTKSGFFKPDAKLKTLAYNPYFYGKDGKIENALADIESEASPLLREIVETYNIPQINSELYAKVLYFLILMSLRNPLASEELISSGEALRKIILDMSDRRVEIDANEMMNKEEAIRTVLRQLDMCVVFCSDLSLKILVNKTNVPFLIADNPVVKYNQFLEQKKWPGCISGYATVGLQLFWPLDPANMLLLYDNSIYKVGNRRERKIIIENANEIDQLNLLQFLNCGSLIFFNEGISEKYLKKVSEESGKYTKANQTITELLPITIRTGGREIHDKVIRQGTTDCKIKLKIDKVAFTKKSKNYNFSNQAVQLRPGRLELLSLYGADEIRKYKLPIRKVAD